MVAGICLVDRGGGDLAPAVRRQALLDFGLGRAEVAAETAIETVSAALAKATEALTVAERDLAAYVAKLTL